jgi:hypothetical protein
MIVTEDCPAFSAEEAMSSSWTLWCCLSLKGGFLGSRD